MMLTTLRYSEALVRSAVAAFWWRTVGWRFVLAFLAVMAYFGYMLAVGDRSWIAGAVGTVLVLGFAFLVTLYFVHLRSSLGRFRRMKTKEATLKADSDKLTLASDVGASELEWSAVSAVWRFEEFWLLFFSGAQFVTLPLADIDTRARDFILERVRTNGGSVA
jgi:hypothetical protein